MKKLMYFAAALLVLAGCNKKDNALNNAPEGTPFKKGQQVTLSVGTGDNANQAAPRKVAGIDNGTQIEFAWEAGDKILVKVGGATAEFTLISGEGTDAGEFAGEMPADGSTFDIQYPVEAPDLNAQVYSSTQIDAKQMLFTATGCTLGNNAVLNAQYAMLQLNLYGENKTIGKIVVTDISNIFDASKPVRSATLTCNGGVTIGADEDAATPFYMVVPAGEYRFEVRIWNNAVTPAKLAWFGTSSAKDFAVGTCMNMPKKEVKVERTYVDLGDAGKWATVNIEDVAPEDHDKKYTYSGGPNPTIEDERWPEKTDFDKLVSFSNKKWVENFLGFGANGYLFINGTEYLFLPAAFDHDGSFWASDADWSSAWTLYISNGNIGEPAISTRTRGQQDGYLIRTMWEHYVN